MGKNFKSATMVTITCHKRTILKGVCGFNPVTSPLKAFNCTKTVEVLRNFFQKCKSKQDFKLYANLKQNKNKIYCDDTYNYDIMYEQEVYFNKKPNAKTPWGAYYYSVEDAIQGVCELTHEEKLEVDKIWFYKRLMLIELGVEYSSNNAGDGPESVDAMFLLQLKAQINGEILAFKAAPSTFKTSAYIEIRNVMYAFNQTRDADRFAEEITIRRMQIVYYHRVAQEADIILDYVYYRMRSLSIQYKCFLNPDLTIQLGVAYSSNNAGDGPDYQEQEKLSKEILAKMMKQSESTIPSAELKMFLLDLSWFLSGLCLTRDIKDATHTIVGFLRMRLKDFEEIEKIIISVLDYFNQLFETQQPQSEKILELMRDTLNKVDFCINSPIVKKIKKFILYILCSSTFRDGTISLENCGYSKLEAQVLRRQYNSKVDFVYVVLDTLLFIAEKGYQIYKTGRVDKIFHSESKYEEWFETTQRLQQSFKSRECDENFVEENFLSELDDTIEKGQNICRFLKEKDSMEKRYIKNLVNEMMSMKFDMLTKKKAHESRKVPFSVLICGDSGIGKTGIIHIIITHYAKIKKLKMDSSMIYTRNPTAKYWDGYRSYCYAVILDDIAFLNPNVASGGGDPSCMEFLQVINNVPFVPDQADLSDKGRIPFKSSLVIGTTNTADLNAHAYFSCPSAVQRRFPFLIEPEIKDEYRDAKTGILSVPKDQRQDDMPEYWWWNVKIVKPTPLRAGRRQMAQTEKILEKANLQEFLIWLTQAILEHDEKQDQTEKSISIMQATQYCDMCNMPKKYCLCEVQSIRENIMMIHEFYRFWYWTCAKIGVIIAIASIIMQIFIQEPAKLFDIGNVFVHVYYCITKPRVILRSAGRKAYNQLKRPKVLVIITAVSTGLFAIWRCINTFKPQSEDCEDKDHNEKKCQKIRNDDVENPWYKNDYVLSTFDVSNQTLSSKGLSVQDINRITQRNVCRIACLKSDGTLEGSNIFCIFGQVYVANLHTIEINEKKQIDLTIYNTVSKDAVNPNVTITLYESDYYVCEGRDIVFLRIRHLPPKKDLSCYVAQETYRANTHGIVVYKDKHMMEGSINLRNLWYDPRLILEQNSFKSSVWHYVAQTPTRVGMCGSPIIAISECGYVIVGIHMAGYEHNGCCVALNQSDVMVARRKWDFQISESEPHFGSGENFRELGDLHKKSCVRYVPQGCGNVYGSFVGHRSKPKSRVVETHCFKFFNKIFPKQHDRPVMSGWVPWRIALLDMTSINMNIDVEILDRCTTSFANDILARLTPGDLTLLHPLTMKEAINGAAGVRFIDKVNRNTSAGFPWMKSKRYVMHAIDPYEEMMHPVDVDDSVKERIALCMEKYDKGERYCPVFTAHLKDEPTSYKKIKDEKTRVFAGAPVDWTIVNRKMLLTFVRLYQTFRFIFEGAPGVNHASVAWQNIYTYLTQFGKDRIVAGDFKAFDKKMSACFILNAFKIIHRLCAASGNFTEKDLKCIIGIAYDTAFSFQNFNGDLIQFFGSNPSGHPLTVIINGMVNSLYMRYAYSLANPAGHCDDFKENVALMTYGDDNCMGVNKNCNFFDHTVIQRQLSKIGVTYTMADKTSESIPFVNISDITFLKRAWRYEPEMGLHVSPLEEDSIAKSLLVQVRSKSVTPEKQMVDAMNSAHHEYFLYGREKFDEMSALFQRAIREYQLDIYVEDSMFPTFDSLKETYLKRQDIFDEHL